jgi:hypothetical protein
MRRMLTTRTDGNLVNSRHRYSGLVVVNTVKICMAGWTEWRGLVVSDNAAKQETASSPSICFKIEYPILWTINY